MGELKIFQNNEFGEIRTVVENGEPWFVGKDVAESLGYKYSADALKRHVDDEDKLTRCFTDSGQRREMYIINESGLYSLILSSKLPNAKKFKRWVTNEVLPFIRQHGAYMSNEVIEKTLSDPDYLIQLATTLKEERARRELAEAENIRNRPKVLFSDSCEVASNSILIGELAKRLKQNGLDIGQNKLFRFMRENGYLCKKKGEMYNTPTQYSMERGWFEMKVRTINNADGSTRTTTTTKVTGKGQIYFTNLLLGGNC